MPSRRQVLGFLAGGTTAMLAGCITPGGALSMTPVETDRAIGVATTGAVDPARDADTAALLEEAAAGGTDVVAERPPFDPYRPVRWRGGVYAVSFDRVAERTRTEFVVVAEPTDEPSGRRIAYEDLPAVDRMKFADLREEIDGEERVGARVTYTDDVVPASDTEGDAVAESVLVPEPQYAVVTFDGEAVSIESGETETTVFTFTYEVTERAASPAAYGTALREQHLFELDGLTGDEADLVEEAIAEETAVVGRNDEAFVGVGETLLEHEPIYVHGRVGEWLVEYESTTYWTELDALRTTTLVEQLESHR